MNIESLISSEYSVSQVDIEKARNYQKKFGGRLEKILVNIGSIDEDVLPKIYSELLGCEYIDDSHQLFSDYSIPDWAKNYDTKLLISRLWFPVPDRENQFVVSDPFDWEVNQYLLSHGIRPSFYLATKDILITLEKSIAPDSGTSELGNLNEVEEDRLKEMASEAPTVNLLNNLISKGLKYRASDLHIEPVGGKYRLRYRVDGVLKDEGVLPQSLSLPVLSRVKILSGMDIAEKRRPQDGKIEAKISGVELDIRVSALPLNKGESIVLRFLRKDSVSYSMASLGISDDTQDKILVDLKSTAGVILLTGPTGSGKTTSLYTFLNELNSDQVKIITLEDPVEYQLDGINQVQVNADIGFDFSAGLRSIVRQDPDIIMLGEIRDQETARIAMQSALTGHLVFSTVHTNDAPSAYTRLVDLGVEEFLLNAAIVSVMAQRLVRRVCEHCCRPITVQELKNKSYSSAKLEEYYIENGTYVEAIGCEQCALTGYKGRLSIMEYLPCDEKIRSISKDSYFIPEAKLHNKNLGNRTLLEDGLRKAASGVTTVDEVLRVCS
ncbi:MAG: GspE/PulE family protein [Aestuariibacter sp.]